MHAVGQRFTLELWEGYSRANERTAAIQGDIDR